MLTAKIEALLFAAAKPITIKKIAETLGIKTKEAEAAISELMAELNNKERGTRIVRSGSEIQMMTSPEHSKLVRDFLKSDITGELTKPQLETLTVIAYRQPITKPELEQIRGVNCSLILRNLAMRGLIEEEAAEGKLGPVYRASHEFLRHLGVSQVSELPEYEKLKNDERIPAILDSAYVSDSKNQQ